MSNREDRNLRILSAIDEEILDKQTEARYERMSGVKKKNRRRLIVSLTSAVAALALIMGTLLLLIPLLGKQVPVYTGMTVSGSAPSVSVSVGNPDYLDNGNHYGHVNGNGNHIDQDKPFHPDGPTIDDAIADSLQITGTSQEIYYARPNSSVYVTVHFDNPDNFLIQGFTLGGQTFASYMFIEGSDMENITVELKIGDVEGIVEYTISNITYIDRDTVKYVEMGGDPTIKIGVATDEQPGATVSAENISYNSIGFSVSASDLRDLIGISEGKLQAVLYDGTDIVATKDISATGTTEVRFDGLAVNTLYQYAIVATYDALDGQGIASYTLAKKAFYTKAAVLFDNVAVAKDSVSFALLFGEDYNSEIVESIALWQNDTKLQELPTDTTSIGGLTPATDYRVVLTYTFAGRSEEIVVYFTTVGLKITVNHYCELLGGGYATEPTTTEEIGVPAGVSVEIPTKVFEGFTAPTAEQIVPSATNEPTINYYYTRNSYTVTFIDRPNAAPRSELLQFGAPLPELENVGYIFGGWFSEQSYTTHLDSVPATNITLYAKWTTEVATALYLMSGNTITGITDHNITELNIPERVAGVQVKAIAANAFANCRNLVSVTIPETCVEVSGQAFANCPSLSSVVFAYPYGWADGSNMLTLTSPTQNASEIKAGSYQALNCSLDRVGFVFTQTEAGDAYYISALDKSVAEAALGSTIDAPVALQLPAYYQGLPVVSLGKPGVTDYSTGISTLPIASLSIPAGITWVDGGFFSKTGAVEDLSAIAVDPANTAYMSSGNCLIARGTGELILGGKQVTIPVDGSVTSIGAYAFYKRNMTSVEIPGSVKKISSAAFVGCQQLTTVTLCEGIEWIGDYAFHSCNLISSVQLPSTLLNTAATTTDNSSFGNPFYGCDALASITMAASNEVYRAEGNCLIHIPTQTLVQGSASSVIPQGVTAIAYGAFYSCLGLEEILIPESVLSIGRAAFGDCSALRTLTIRSGLQDIGASAFVGCTALTEVVIPDSLQTLGNSAFSGCSLLSSVTIGNGLQSIGERAFQRCSALTGITIPANVKTIGLNAFSNCTQLATITLNEGLVSIGDAAFSLCKVLAGVVLPASLEEIGQFAFSSCAALTSIEIPAKVETIGKSAFAACSKLVTVTLNEGLVTIGESAFQASGLVAVTIPASVDSIGNSAFKGCRRLTTLTINDGVESIGNSAFGQCVVLDNVAIPASVKTIGESAFVACAQLGLLTLNEGLVSIGSSAFCNCSELFEVTIPASVRTIGSKAFSGDKGLSRLTINDGVESIGERAFENCTELRSATLPASVKTIGLGAFNGCTVLTNITLPFVGGSADATEASKSTAFGYIFGDTTYTDAVETTQYYGPSSTVTYYLPASLTEVTLTGGSVFYGSFSFCTKLRSVDMPAGEYAIPESCFYGCKMLQSLGNNDAHITAIGAYAFKNCSWIEALDGCPVPVIGKEAFMNCTRLSKVRLTAENLSIGQNAFKGCTALETLSLPASLAAIDASAFENVLSIKKLTAPTSALPFVSTIALTSAVINGGTKIPAHAFENATHLTEVTIGDSITAIGASAFSNTAVEKVYISDLSVWLQIDFAGALANPIGGASLYVDGTLTESITVPTGITAIKNYAFYSAQIQSVNLHADVTSIGNGAFSGCTGLTEITLPQGLKSIGSSVFKDCTGLANIYYNAISMNDVASAADAFAGIKAALHIGSDVTRIPAYIFIGSDMTSVEFAGNACAEIGDHAFSHCTRLIELSLPVGLQTIGDYAFSNCTRLAELSLPVGLQTIGDYAFLDCDPLSKLELPEGLTTLGAGAFESCMELEETTLPTTLKTVGSYAIDKGYIYIKDIAAYCQINVTPDANGVVRGFGSIWLLSEGYGGSSISELVVPKEVTSLGNIWSGNYALVSVTFEEGSALTSIAEGAFENCYSLQSVHLPAAMNGQSVDLLIEDVLPDLADVYCEWAEADDLDGDFNLSRADFYYYSATQAQDCWHWVNGKPTLW